MIVYRSKRIWVLRKLLRVNGSVFPSAFIIAVPCAAIACAMRWHMNEGGLHFIQDEDSILKETQLWSGFTFLVGFLIVFRTSQAYSRFWEGCTATHQMRAEWLDGVSALIAFSEYSRGRVAPEKAKQFKAKIIRLFSLLHTCALGELEVMGTDFPPYSEVAAFRYDVIDPGGLDRKSLLLVKESHSKVQLVYSWVQCAIVEGMRDGVLTMPAPILSRAFQEIANGMVQFHDAMKISGIPFPFPYTQTCDALLVIHWVMAPFVTTQWVTSYAWAAIFVFIQVFVLWALNFIAIEIENPFGTDPNDLDGRTMQMEMNQHLLLLLRESSVRTPRLNQLHTKNEAAEDGSFTLASMCGVWGGTATQVFLNQESEEQPQWHEKVATGLKQAFSGKIERNPAPSRFKKPPLDPPPPPTPSASEHPNLKGIEPDSSDEEDGADCGPLPSAMADSPLFYSTDPTRIEGLADGQILLDTIDGLAELVRRRVSETPSQTLSGSASARRSKQEPKEPFLSQEPEAHPISTSLRPKLFEPLDTSPFHSILKEATSASHTTMHV
mmetsp:Transcript_25208/g.58000  ORF Transcript_25208/g.58000 Transcript_25208/m.58000 type:complete len:551 (-) Transcript_25208:33-1685(-)